MPQIDFAPENLRAHAQIEFDKFKLEKDEKARIVLFEKPNFAWAHVLRAPKIVDGHAVKVMKQRRARRGEAEGEKYEDYDMDFIGGPLCLGDYSTVDDKGSDPANCPACKAARESEHILPPERRFAANIIRYALGRDGRPVVPFSCTCVVWRFPEKMYGQLHAIANEYAESGGLLGRDLLLTCVSGQYQNYDMIVGGNNWWQVNPDIKQRVMTTYQENRVADLDAACGRRVEARWILDDIARVHERWAIVNGTRRTTDGTAAAETLTLSDDIAALMATTAPATQPAAAAPAPAAVDLAAMLAAPVTNAPVSTGLPDVGDLFGGTPAPAAPTPIEPAVDLFAGFTTPTTTQRPAAASPAPAAAPAPTQEAVDFNALLSEFK